MSQRIGDFSSPSEDAIDQELDVNLFLRYYMLKGFENRSIFSWKVKKMVE